MARVRTPSGNEDVNFRRCSRCGFPCDLSRDKIKAGNGMVYTAVTHSVQDTAPDSGTPNFGCPQCGRGEYNTK